MTTELERFLNEHPVFSRKLFAKEMGNGNKNLNTLKNILAQHLERGHIVRIKRGLLASIPRGVDPKIYAINPFLIASSLTDDAVIAYHTALALYGVNYSTSFRFIYLTQCKAKQLKFRGETYQASLFPISLLTKAQTHCYVNFQDIQGVDIKVTSKERTLVDVMDRPLLGGGWEEIWRSLDMIEYFKIDDIIKYALILENATTIAKVGFYLEQRSEELNVTPKQLIDLQEHKPHSPHYMDSVNRDKSRYIKRWNLMVPLSLLNRDWEENLEWEPKV